MDTYAIIKDGIVVNLIEYDSQPTAPPAGFEAGHEAVKATGVSTGWVYANGAFTDPNPPVVIPQTYRELRANAYPPIGDQLDALWKGGAAAEEMLTQIQAVKARYPKGA